MIKVAGLVLAGGRSTRMGHDKASLRVGESRLIDKAVSSLVAICNAGVWVGGRDYGYSWFADCQEIAGPMSSLVNLAQVDKSASAFIVLPVDMPLAGEKLGPLLLNAFFQDRNSEAFCFDESHFPILLKTGEAYQKKVDEWKLRTKSRSVTSFLDFFKIRKLKTETSDLDFFMNLNYPREYKEYVVGLSSKRESSL